MPAQHPFCRIPLAKADRGSPLRFKAWGCGPLDGGVAGSHHRKLPDAGEMVAALSAEYSRPYFLDHFFSIPCLQLF